MKCERCGSDVGYAPGRPDALDEFIRSTADIEELRRLLIIRTDRLSFLRGQVEVLKELLREGVE